jgi:hypothetical protein
MQQAKFSLSDPLLDFLSHYRQYGFKDRSAMVQAALLHLQRDIEQRQLRESAALYAEVYAEDDDLQELTDCAINGWPE